MNRIIFSIFSMVISGAPFIGAIQAQSPTPIIVQAASQATQSAPVSSRPTATTNSGALTAAINGLEEIKAANAETLKKQDEVLQKLDEMQKAADQLRIFAHRTGG
jgi:hypothetical protein